MTASIFISAGEASGEFYGAELAAALSREFAPLDKVAGLLQQHPTPKGKTTELWGMGGARMAAAGVECIVRAEDVAVMGFTEVVLHLPRIYREFRKLKRAIRERRPAVAVLIDFPEIHFRLAKEFHRLGIPVIYFVSPQLWAWKQHRIKLVERYVKRMLVIFPFEERFYRERGVAAEFVGHPLADLPMPAVSRVDFAAENGLDAGKAWIGILPGSRMKEIEANLPEMLEAARGVVKDFPQGLKPEDFCSTDGTNKFVPFHGEGRGGVFLESGKADSGKYGFEFVLPLAPTLDGAQRAVVAQLVERRGGGLTIRLVDDARAALFHARASVVASGTATVEAALIGNPFVVVYRVSRLTYAIARRLVKVPHVAMANLIAQKRVVPELIQDDFTAANIVKDLRQLLPEGPVRESMMKELGAVREALHVHGAGGEAKDSSAIETVAAWVLKEMEAVCPAALEGSGPIG
jgi:lipid-A-disaccharide synthase